MKTVRRILGALRHYLLYRLRGLWFGIAPPIVLGGLAWRQTSDSVERAAYLQWSSLFLQLGGLLLVAWGYLELREHFGRRPARESISLYFQDFWKSLRGNPVVVITGMGSATASAHATARGRIGPGPLSTLEDRVRLLETSFENLHDELGVVQREAKERHNALADRISEETSKLQKEITDTKALLETTTIGGLGTEVVGWLWLLGSVVMSGVASAQ